MKILVWDLPLRVFHWAFAACIAGALVIALAAGEDHPAFAVHAILGLAACGLLVLRLALGVAGSRHNRLAALCFTPAALLRYLRSATTGGGGRYVAHNPAAATAAVGMFVTLGGLALTGLPLAAEAGEELHEVLAWVMLGLVAAHLAGLAAHTLRHRENIGLSMVTGRKEGPAADGLRSAHPLAAGVHVLLAAAWCGALAAGYDAGRRTVTLPLIGVTFAVGENEQGEARDQAGGQGAAEHDDDD